MDCGVGKGEGRRAGGAEDVVGGACEGREN